MTKLVQFMFMDSALTVGGLSKDINRHLISHQSYEGCQLFSPFYPSRTAVAEAKERARITVTNTILDIRVNIAN